MPLVAFSVSSIMTTLIHIEKVIKSILNIVRYLSWKAPLKMLLRYTIVPQ